MSTRSESLPPPLRRRPLRLWRRSRPGQLPTVVKSGVARTILNRAGATLRPPDSPPWGFVRGHFILAIETVALSPYTIENLGGRLDITADSLTLGNLSGEVLDGKWSADIATGFKRGDPAGEETLKAHFHLAQLDAGHAVRMRFPNPSAGIDGRLDLDATLSSRANRWGDLIPHASGNFTLTGHKAQIRLTLPKEEMISSSLIVSGAVTFSSELRALGRLVRRLAVVPIDRLQASGTLAPNGDLHLEQMRLESPELRLVAVGDIADAKSRDLMSQPLSVKATLAASGDLAVILKGMHLLGPAGADGYGVMNQPFMVVGDVGQPDFHPLYDLLARAVGGSHGTWGILMRKVQAKVDEHHSASQ